MKPKSSDSIDLPQKIIIPVTPSESIFVQNFLFALGYVWDGDSRPMLYRHHWAALEILLDGRDKIIRGFSYLNAPQKNY